MCIYIYIINIRITHTYYVNANIYLKALKLCHSHKQDLKKIQILKLLFIYKKKKLIINIKIMTVQLSL